LTLPQRTKTFSPTKTFYPTRTETSRMTIERTFEQTTIKTPEETLRETSKETIPRTYAEKICSYQLSNWKEIRIIISFLITIEIQ